MTQEEIQTIHDEWVNTSTYTDEGKAYQNIVDSLIDEIQLLRKALNDIVSYPPFDETNNGDRFYEQIQDVARHVLEGTDK